MKMETMSAGDAGRHVRRLEQVLEMPIVCVVAMAKVSELAFVFPAEVDDAYVRWALRAVVAACQDASESR